MQLFKLSGQKRVRVLLGMDSRVVKDFVTREEISVGVVKKVVSNREG